MNDPEALAVILKKLASARTSNLKKLAEIAGLNLLRDFAGFAFECAKFDSIDISNGDFRGCTFIDCSFDNVNAGGGQFGYSRFIRCDIRSCQFVLANFGGAQVLDSKLRLIDFHGARLVGALIEDSTLADLLVDGADLSNARLSSCVVERWSGLYSGSPQIDECSVVLGDAFAEFRKAEDEKRRAAENERKRRSELRRRKVEAERRRRAEERMKRRAEASEALVRLEIAVSLRSPRGDESRVLRLSRREIQLLRHLAEHAGQSMSISSAANSSGLTDLQIMRAGARLERAFGMKLFTVVDNERSLSLSDIAKITRIDAVKESEKRGQAQAQDDSPKKGV